MDALIELPTVEVCGDSTNLEFGNTHRVAGNLEQTFGKYRSEEYPRCCVHQDPSGVERH